MATKNPNAPNSNYRPTNLTPPPGTSGPGTHYVNIGGQSAVVHEGVVHVMTPKAQVEVAQRRQRGKNPFGWEYPK